MSLPGQRIVDLATLLDEANQLKAYLENNKLIRQHSELARLLNLGDKEWLGMDNVERFRTLLDQASLSRITSAILPNVGKPGVLECVKRITSGELDLTSRKHSKGKDALWELELLSILGRHGVEARLAEPDIVANMAFGEYAISCKKINSLNNLSWQIKKGSRQIFESGLPGVIALDVEVLIPDNSYGRSLTAHHHLNELESICTQLMQIHKADMEKYMVKSKIDGYILFLSAPVATQQTPQQFLQATKTIFWAKTEQSKGGQRMKALSQNFPG